MLLRSVVLNNKRSLLSGACNCLPKDGSPNFKGKNRAAANLHTSRIMLQEQQDQARIRTAERGVLESLNGVSESSQAESQPEELLDLEAAALEEDSGMTKEQMEVFERKRRMALSK